MLEVRGDDKKNQYCTCTEARSSQISRSYERDEIENRRLSAAICSDVPHQQGYFSA